MKFIILHGDNQDKITERYNFYKIKAVEKGYELAYLSFTDNLSLKQIFQTKDLFRKKIIYIFQDFNKINKLNYQYLVSEESDVPVIIVGNSKIDKKKYGKIFKKAKEEYYEIPKTIWKFLDNLYPGNLINSLQLFKTTLKSERPEFILSMISRQFKDMYWVLQDPSKIPYASWKVSKLEHQANKFKKARLKKAIGMLAKSDNKIKNGYSEIERELDLFLYSTLE